MVQKKGMHFVESIPTLCKKNQLVPLPKSCKFFKIITQLPSECYSRNSLCSITGSAFPTWTTHCIKCFPCVYFGSFGNQVCSLSIRLNPSAYVIYFARCTVSKSLINLISTAGSSRDQILQSDLMIKYPLPWIPILEQQYDTVMLPSVCALVSLGDPDLILTLGPVYVQFARTPCNRMVFSWVPPHSNSSQVDRNLSPALLKPLYLKIKWNLHFWFGDPWTSIPHPRK